jgi:corrinoid protein of di/trimethylamine methyltransferase
MVIVGDEKGAAKAAQDALDAGVEPYKAIMEGCAKGMERVGELYETKKYFLPEMLVAADAMYSALNLLLPHLKKGESERKEKIVLGVVEGDIHDIGKNIVKAMLMAGGYEVIDLGRDVPTHEFVAKAEAEGAKVIAMSTIMTPTLMSMKGVEEQLEKKGLKGEVRTIIGGGSVTEDWKSRIGSDAFGKDALEAVDQVKLLLAQIKTAVELAKKKRKH